MTLTPALFLDRDGVINIDKGYVHKAEDCVFVEGIFELVIRANKLGYKVFVVTNQAGIARGYYSEAQFLSFSEWMKEQFLKHKARIDEIYFCPHHPIQGLGDYHRQCDCRKPEPGMFLKAKKTFSIDMAKSIMVGDNQSDLEAAQRAGVKNLYLFTHSEPTNIASQNLGSPQQNYEPVMTLNDVHLDSI